MANYGIYISMVLMQVGGSLNWEWFLYYRIQAKTADLYSLQRPYFRIQHSKFI